MEVLLSVYWKKPGEISDFLKIDDIHNFFDENKIKYGVIDDDQINEILNKEIKGNKKIILAKGKDPKEGSNSSITINFNNDYLKAGKLMDHGMIDFKNRGDIPFIKKGEVIAQMVPKVDGVNGVNIFWREHSGSFCKRYFHISW